MNESLIISPKISDIFVSCNFNKDNKKVSYDNEIINRDLLGFDLRKNLPLKDVNETNNIKNHY